MYKINNVLIGFIFLSSSVLMFSSCATIFSGKKNTINVMAGSPKNAQVFLDGKLIGEAPFKMRVVKTDLQEGSLIEVRKDNYKTMVFKVKRSPHVAYVVADIFSGVIPLVVDVATGNIYRPNTRKIEYVLEPVNEKKVVKAINRNKEDIK